MCWGAQVVPPGCPPLLVLTAEAGLTLSFLWSPISARGGGASTWAKWWEPLPLSWSSLVVEHFHSYILFLKAVLAS